MAENKKKKVFDVANPGSSTALPTSRPVIIPRHAIDSDPMVTDKKKSKIVETNAQDEENDVDKDPATDLPKEITSKDISSKKVIQPLKEETEDDDQPNNKSEGQDDNTEIQDGEEQATDEDDKKDDKSDAKKASDEAKDQENQEKYKKLIDDKTYYVPVGAVRRRRNTQRVLTILIITILLVLVAANFLIDAGIIQTDIKPLTDVIPN